MGMRGRGKVGREGRGGCVIAVGGIDAPDQLIEVKVCPQYNFLNSPPLPEDF